MTKQYAPSIRPLAVALYLALGLGLAAGPAAAQDKTQGDQIRVKVDNAADVVVGAIKLYSGGGKLIAKDDKGFATGGTRSAKWNVIMNPAVNKIETWLNISLSPDDKHCGKKFADNLTFTVDGDQVTSLTLPDGTVLTEEPDNSVDQIFRVRMKLGGSYATGLTCGYRGYKVYKR